MNGLAYTSHNAPKNRFSERLIDGIDIRGADECWPWKKNTGNHGYGTIVRMGKTLLAHRLVYEHCVGQIRNGLQVMHTCDNPLCCNPAHLRLGTFQDNMDDCTEKGRRARSLRHWNGRLTDDQVRAIRAFRAAKVPAKQVAERFGITPGTVYAISNGHKRRYVT